MILTRNLLVLLFFGLVAPLPAAAIEPEQREVVVTHNRLWDGFAYVETFVPSDHEELVLFAGADNAISFVQTFEYYWPLSRQKYVAFERQREEIEGSLHVSGPNGLDHVIERQPYVILYPEGAVNGNAQLIWGEAAMDAFNAYREDEKNFVRAFTSAQRAHSIYEKELLKSGRERLAGESVQEITPPLPLPEPSLKLETAPQLGFRVALSPGVYSGSVSLNGQIVSGTQKQFRVVDLEAVDVVIAEVVPEERWTRPLTSNTQETRIYSRPGTTFYTTFSRASRYEEVDYLGVTSPQKQVVDGRQIWIKRGPAELSEMDLTWENNDVQSLPLAGYKVDQTGGASFGYAVRTAEATEKADLNAFAVVVPEEGNVRRGVLRVVDAATKNEILRTVIVVQPRNAFVAWGIALAPVLIWFMLLLSRRRRLTA